MNGVLILLFSLVFGSEMFLYGQGSIISSKIDKKDFNPATLLWYEALAEEWEEALPVGNGRLGRMVFGRVEEERIQLNEETYWSGGPYSTVVSGGAEVLPEIQKHLFDGEPLKAHKLFGRYLMGYPVEQAKYQSLANLHLFFNSHEEASGYKRWLDLETGVSGVEYSMNGVRFRREILASAPDQVARTENYLRRLEGKSYASMVDAAINDYRKFFDRVSLELPKTGNSYLPTVQRMAGFEKNADPNLASLCYNFARYVLISASRPGTEAANLQGILNKDMNPSWDSKYTANINLEMNYWQVETGDLSDCAEPLITLVKELTDQGSQVARKHYGAGGWVFHQNTDLWRVAAPMDGPTWGTFTTGGAWLTTQRYEHYLYNRDIEYLADVYPVIKGAVQFFMDFLVEHPNGKWLVTNPSTSPENPPKGPGYQYFFDEVIGAYYFTTICYGSSIDMQILSDLFGYFIESAAVLGLDQGVAAAVAEARERLVPPQIGKDGTLQEWTEDLEQLEDKHRHFSHMYGLYPGNVISVKRTPQLIDACKAVLEQRGDGGTGFSRGWKMALWARLYDGNRAEKIFRGYIQEQCYPQLFAKCFTPLQIDGTQGAAAGITEMLMQSHEGVIDLLPALPDQWNEGRFDGVKARGGFELDMTWKDQSVKALEISSRAGETCRIDAGGRFTVMKDGNKIKSKRHPDGTLEFETIKGGVYKLIRR